MNDLSNMNRLRKEMDLPPLPANDNAPAKPLPVIDPRTWQGVPVKERQWFVEGLIPAGTVTSLSGDGGTGKSQLALQLIAASALRAMVESW